MLSRVTHHDLHNREAISLKSVKERHIQYWPQHCKTVVQRPLSLYEGSERQILMHGRAIVSQIRLFPQCSFKAL